MKAESKYGLFHLHMPKSEKAKPKDVEIKVKQQLLTPLRIVILTTTARPSSRDGTLLYVGLPLDFKKFWITSRST